MDSPAAPRRGGGPPWYSCQAAPSPWPRPRPRRPHAAAGNARGRTKRRESACSKKDFFPVVRHSLCVQSTDASLNQCDFSTLGTPNERKRRKENTDSNNNLSNRLRGRSICGKHMCVVEKSAASAEAAVWDEAIPTPLLRFWFKVLGGNEKEGILEDCNVDLYR